MKDHSYQAVMARRVDIMKSSLGIDYKPYTGEGIRFDYEALMGVVDYGVDEVRSIQRNYGVGNTQLIELQNLTSLARAVAPDGKGARIFVKDEASNPSGSYKDRRASLSVHHAQTMGYRGVGSATSGNYGAAVASQAAMHGMESLVVQEVFDSQGIGQPEILEKSRKCEAYGAEVIQVSVGPELFYMYLRKLEETGYFNASLYTPYAIAGIEPLGFEIAEEFRTRFGGDPDVVVCTNAGGGNLTGTARGLKKAGAKATQIVAASVDLQGLHMASDRDFNRKQFTTGHTGFGVPFASWPDRVDVPRNAARPLRYIDRYLLVKQGEVFFITEALAQLEGLERGPAGNTSLAAAFALACEMDADKTIVVQETEYTGAGKNPTAQLTFARERGVSVYRGNPDEEVPGTSVVIPEGPEQIRVRDLELARTRRSFILRALEQGSDAARGAPVSQEDVGFLCQETNSERRFVEKTILESGTKLEGC